MIITQPIFCLFFPHKTIGRKNLPQKGDKGKYIICANHISNLDPYFLLMVQSRPIRYMAKAELFKSRLAVWFFQKQYGAFPVRRGEGDTGAIDTAVNIVNSGGFLGIFPEGTRSKDGKLGRAKSGAALIASRTGANVIPVAIMAPHQKSGVFRFTKIIFGQPLSPAELHLEDSEHPDLRYASRLIMEKITQMMEENR